MYKAVFVKDTDDLTGSNHVSVKEMQADLSQDLRYGAQVLGYDGLQWALYQISSKLPFNDTSREWIKTPRSTYNSYTYGDIIIQQLLDTEFLVIVQDVTEEEYDVQLALGTIIKGPLKICALATCVTAVRKKIVNT